MQLQASKSGQPRYPRARFRPSWVLWLFVALGLNTCIVFAAFNLAQRANVSDNRNFNGTLKPTKEPAFVVLPQGVPFETLTVDQGAEVREGQTVATLDISKIENRLLELDQEILSNQIQVSCLLNSERVQSKTSIPSDATSQLIAEAAQEACHLFFDQKSFAFDRIKNVLEIANNRLLLLDAQIKVLREEFSKSTSSEKAKVDLLNASLERNKLLGQIAQLKSEQTSLAISWRTKTLEKIDTLTSSITESIKARAVLQYYLDKPRLVAPNAGIITKIRPLKNGIVYTQAVELLQIQSDDNTEFEVRFTVESKIGQQLKIGQLVRLQPFGSVSEFDSLEGTIARFAKKSETLVDVIVLLSAESIDQITDSFGGLNFMGTNSATDVKISFGSEPVWSGITRATTNLFSKNFIDVSAFRLP